MNKDFFDRVVVINLKRRPERLQNFLADLYAKAWPFKHPDRFNAVDGEVVPPPDGWKAGNGGWGCMLSHIRILEAAITDGAQSLLVFEDDAIPSDDFAERIPQFLAELPDDWDAIWLGGQNFGPAESVSGNIVKIKAPHRMHAYVLCGRILRDVYQKLVSSKDHCDHTLTRWIGRRYNVYAPKVPLFGQRGYHSDINGSDHETHWWGFGNEQERQPQTIRVADGIAVTVKSVGYGEVKCDGTLGYDSPIVNGKVMVGNTRPLHTISAHADSELFIETIRHLSIQGATNASANIETTEACAFWIDDHWIGDLRTSSEVTPAIQLPPGRYRLRVESISGNAGKHTLWLITEPTKRDPCTTALVTIGCYNRYDVKEKMKWLHYSAAKEGMLLRVFGCGTPYVSHYNAKIERLASWIDELPSIFSRVLYLDGRDTAIVGNERKINRIFSALQQPVIIGAESMSWPIESAEWRGFFSKPSSGLAFPQAGMFMGERDELQKCFAAMNELRSEVVKGKDNPVCAMLRGWTHDDQAFWQGAYALGLLPNVRLDCKSSLLLNLTCLNGASLCDGKHAWIADGTVKTEWDTSPPCLHFSGAMGWSVGTWIGQLKKC